MKKILSSILTITLLSGCASLDKWTNFEDNQTSNAIDENEAVVSSDNRLRPSNNLKSGVDFQSQYKDMWQTSANKQSIESSAALTNNKTINHYVRGIMQDLLNNLQYVNSTTPVAVSSFVFLDSDFERGTLLGNQIAEGFMHEVHKLGIPVVDFKATDYIRVTREGDFALSKDYVDLSTDVPIRYVLTGTLVKHQKGIMVNARIVGISSKAIVASAQGFIPSYISEHIVMSKTSNDGMPISFDP